MNTMLEQIHNWTSHILQGSHCSYEDAKPAQAVKNKRQVLMKIYSAILITR